MIEFFLGHYAYWFVLILLVIGLYGMIIKHNLVKKVIGLSIFQVAIILFFIASSTKWEATVPVLSNYQEPIQASAYINPLPHTLMLTAIVVGVATSGVAFALLILTFRRYKTLNETELLKRMDEEDAE